MSVPRVILVTGASSGIGQSCAELLAQRGHRVYGASRGGASRSGASRSAGLTMDVRDEASVKAAVRTILDREQRLDVVINNAGFGIAGAVEDTSSEEAKEQFEVNFFGVLRVCRAVLPVMRSQRQGLIVNIGSIGGLIAIPYQGLYSATKFALEGLTESLRLEVREFGINVVLIEPGDHRTGFTKNRRSTLASGDGSPYRAGFEHAVARMAADEQAGPPPERVAALVSKVIDDPRPRLRYTVGPAPQRAAVWLKRLLPYTAIEAIMRQNYLP
jgi:NAD(P)-dependent dehydrogenase (short-subunit alcohol dehydrogenase family)